jgi:ribosomal-protein-alanine N-acetyltransferase
VNLPLAPATTPRDVPAVIWQVDRADATDRDAVVRIAREAGLSVDFDAELDRDFARLWVARAGPDEAAVAFLHAWIVADELQIQDVATAHGHRRRGAARALLRRASSDAGERTALLEVRASNRAARELYRRGGFRETGRRRGYYEDGEDAIEMRLDVRRAAPRSRGASSAEAR